MDLHSVLVVDDEQDIRLIAEMALAHVGGWAVTTAASGADGVERARSMRPDLVLLDMMMPGMDGMETLHELRSDPATAGIPVVFMTAKVLPGEIGSYIEAGAHGVIAKPFDPLTLPDEIRRALAARADAGRP
jgi:two-component system, OmpR family, response regulator